MNILVTGGCGFIGSNFIINQIAKTDNSILNYDILTYAGKNNNLDLIKNNGRYKFIKGNICDRIKIDECLVKFNPDWIVNFAAESHVDRSISSPSGFIDTNIVGTATLLQSINDTTIQNKPKLLHVSTDEVYGSLGEKGSFDEGSKYLPNSPYAASKASSDLLVRAWQKTYGLPSIITNCSNNYGPMQFPEKLIPLTIKNCLEGKSIPIYGNGLNIRDWIHVKDHCNALNMILDSEKIGESYNIGGGYEISNIRLVKKICEILDNLKPMAKKVPYSSLIEFVEDRAGHDFRYAINNKKIKLELGWKPRIIFDDGLKDTVKWYLNNKVLI
tara:strand:- start:183 stop:1169 length:987 start_codon:yes stop_codon:yes gene_type:complete